MYLGVDYVSNNAYDALKAKGVGFVCRYLCPPWQKKILTSDEARSLSEAGFNIVSVWEDNSVKASWFNWDRGIREGSQAVEMAQLAGQPAGTAVYFAVDYDAQDADMPAIAAYFDAVQSVIAPYKVGVYGGYRVIDYFAGRVPFLWQTYAWSAGRVHPKAQLYQFQNGVNIGGQVDLDKCFAEPGWWRIGGVITPPEYKEELGVPIVKMNDKGPAVSVLQALLNAVGYACPVNGAFALDTLGAVKAFQRDKALAVDGIVGPITWGALAAAPPVGKDALAQVSQIKAILK